MDTRFKVEKVNNSGDNKPVNNRSCDNIAFGINGSNPAAADDDAFDLQYNSLPLHERVGQLNNDETGSENLDAVADIKCSSTICLPDFANRRRRSLAQMTREALPRLDFYRNSRRALRRPSLGELHGEEVAAKVGSQIQIEKLKLKVKNQTPRFKPLKLTVTPKLPCLTGKLEYKTSPPYKRNVNEDVSDCNFNDFRLFLFEISMNFNRFCLKFQRKHQRLKFQRFSIVFV